MMGIVKKGLSAALFVGAVLLGGLGIALHAADGQAKKASTRDVLDPLFEKSEWKAEWIEDVQAYQVYFKGPDVYVRVAGDFVVVQSYLGRAPRDVASNDLVRVLRRNYDLYQGKFGLDKDMDLWFEINTSKRLMDAEELNRQIAFVADAADDAKDLIKTETPKVTQ